MSLDPFDLRLYTETPKLEEKSEPEPLQETNSREYNAQMEPTPDDVVEILDHYKNLKLTDAEVEELRADLANRDSMDLAILYDELVKLHKRTDEDPKDKLFLQVIKDEFEDRGPGTLELAKKLRKENLMLEKQRLVSQRQAVKASANAEKMAVAKAEEAEYQRMVHEFYTEWERVKQLGFEFPWLNTGKATHGSRLPAPVKTSAEDFNIPVAKNAEEELKFAKTVNLNPLPGHNEFTRDPAKFASVNPEALDVNAEPEAAVIAPDKTPYDMAPRKTDTSRNHPGINDKRVDKEKFLAGLKESSIDDIARLLYSYEELNEESQNETNTEVIEMLRTELNSRELED